MSKPNPSITAREVLRAWRRILCGNLPMLSIEITRECPLSCPGCYAYGESHLAGTVQLRDLADLRGDALVNGVLQLVEKHRPMHVSLVGGEPLIRHRELSAILPALSARNIFTLVVTSAVLPIPTAWMRLPRVRVAVSVDGLPEHHDIRRRPATYDRILQNIARREVNIHWVVTRPMLERSNYFEQYVSFWNARPEVNRIWVSTLRRRRRKAPKCWVPRIADLPLRNLPSSRSLTPNCCFMKASPGLFCARRKTPTTAFSQKCRLITLRICARASSPAFSAERRTAHSAGAWPAPAL